MDTDTLTEPEQTRGILARISTLEWVVAGVVVVVLLVLVLLEPDILQAPFESFRSIAVVVGGTAIAAVALYVMVRAGVPPVIRVLVLLVPFVAVSWWLLSPFFIDEEVNDRFSTSIAAAQGSESDSSSGTTEETAGTTAPSDPATTPTTAPTTVAPAPAPTGPVLLGSGTIVGLAGHDGTGDAGIFRLEDGTHVVRLENLDIDNGPDLKLYLVPGADRRSPEDGSHSFGALRGNVGNQTYDVPSSYAIGPGEWTVLVWCEAFTVEFVAATLTIA